ncbi:lytic transglycosylase domain-containing protein [uncultured Desulfosarcina sp.]|uniref:lytic transglycosylase domain-containing protein n=1 Tax=uncultured Desulfosarcina sp. TaxID=218289 RepID=UPI0029C83B3F|nr:lytic transglycosylase domain-containing protein [uncultured Desulfosarcina sp.]
MISKTQMTIDVYLKRAGVQADALVNRKHFIPLKSVSGSQFQDVLDSVSANEEQASEDPVRGATLTDYRKLRHSDPAAAFFSQSTIFGAVQRQFADEPYGSHSYKALRSPSTSPESIGASTASIDTKVDAGSDNDGSIQDGIRQAAATYNLPEKLIASVIQAESGFRPDAVSPAGAQGLMQLMPATARELGVTDPFDIHQNIDGGAKYLRQMMDRFDGDLKLALAAYNAGPGTVARYDGEVPYRETRDYVKRVLAGMA